ncbi:MAG: hypothetical protein JSV65_01710, partial [Armatimonadota bacterium]
YYDTHPEERDLIRDLIRAGRIGTGGSYNEPTEKLISAEGIIRNIVYGRLYHERVLGDQPLVYAPWDVFGHCAQLSQILAKSRFAGCIWSKHIYGFHPVFWHQAPDGTKMLYRRLSYSYRSEGPEDLLYRINKQRVELQTYGLNCDIRIDAGDFKPPTAWMAGMTQALRDGTPSVDVTGSGQTRFMLDLHQRIKEHGLRVPVTARDMEYHHQGTAITRVQFKIGNRLGENAVINAEKFGAVASALGATYPDVALDKAWRQLLFNQHHDGITGPCCDRSYLDLMASYRESLELATETLDSSLRYIGSLIDTAGPAPDPRALPLAVFNPLNWTRTDVCRATVELPAGWDGFALRDAAAEEVPVELVSSVKRRRRTRVEFRFVASDIPSIGYRLFYVTSAEEMPPQPASKRGTAVENEFFRLRVDRAHGGIVSLYDKQARRELVNVERGPGNELVALAENATRREPPWEVWTTGPKAFSRDYPAEAEVRRGPVSASLVIRGEMKDCAREQEITLYRGLRRIDCVTRLVNYRGKHDLFVVTFPSALQGCEPVFEERCAVVTRRKSKGYLDFRTASNQNASECGLRSAYQWFAHSSSARLRMGAKGAANAASFALGMVALVIPHDDSTEDAAYALQSRLVGKGIFCTPLHDDLDRRRRAPLEIEDCTLPKNLNDDLRYGTSFRIALDVNGGNRFAKKLVGRLSDTARSRFERRREKDGYAFVFMLDDDVPAGWAAVPTLIISALDDAALRRGIDYITRDFADSADINLPANVNASGSREQVDDYTLAIANLGNIMTSIESDNTMVLGLMHTSAWGGTPWGKDRLPWFIVPEHKTHVYPYAFYPSPGDWRAAGTYRVGYEFNNPLMAVALDRHAGALAPTMSCLEVEGDGLIVTALKRHGNPTAGFEGAAPVDDPGVTVRLYEALGNGTDACLRWFTPLGAVWETNLLEERQRPVDVCPGSGDCARDHVGRFVIQTYNLRFRPPEVRGEPCRLGREIEPVQPMHFRHWDHNLGEAPLGYSPVSVVLEGQVRTGIHIRQGGVTTNELTLGVCNNYLDRRIRGRVELVVPEGWKTVPEYVEYDLGPNEHMTRTVLLCFMSGQRSGLVKARLTHEGQVYQDVVEVGDAPRIEWDVENLEGRIEARLRNVGDDAIEGGLALITPMEMWGAAAGDFALAESHSPVRGFALKPGEEATYGFDVAALGPASALPDYWAVVKLFYNGRVDYRYVPGLNIPAPED